MLWVKLILNEIIKLNSVQNVKYFNTSSLRHLKEITIIKGDKKTTFDGKIICSPREPYLLQKKNSDACCVCSTDLDIKHTDVLILSQFVRSDGCMLPRRVTGLCKLQQKRISNMVSMAQKAGLMSNLSPSNSKKDPSKRLKWKKYNTYFDESTIKPPKIFPRRPTYDPKTDPLVNRNILKI